MDPKAQIAAIRRAAGGEVSPSEIRQAAKVIETSTPRGILMSVAAAEEFVPALLEAAEGTPAAEETAWLTLAAAGPKRTRLALAWFGVTLVDRAQLVDVAIHSRQVDSRKVCAQLAEAAADDESWGAWLLFAHMLPSQLRRMVKAHPRLSGKYRAARNAREVRQSQSNGRKPARRRGGKKLNPVIAAQFAALGITGGAS